MNITNFTFNNATKLIQLNANLIAGNNSVIIYVTNAYGNAVDNVQIVYGVRGNPPTVTILTPSINPFTTTQTSTNIIAEVKNVTDKSQISVLVNGIPVQGFNYNNATSRVQFNANVSIGNNSVSIKATNIHGTDLDDIQIIYRIGDSGSTGNGIPPKVKIINPNTNPFTSDQMNVNVIAEVENVTSKSQIEVKLNGNSTINYDFNATTKRLQLNATLSAGSNIVSIKATNSYGSDNDETQIYLKKVIDPNGLPPVVSFITPNAEYKVVEFPSFTMIAHVENVSKKSDVKLYFNGNVVNPNNYVFNPSMQTINYLSDLVIGQNTFKVVGENIFGSHQATAKIERKRKEIGVDPNINEPRKPLPCEKPTMSFTSPASNVTTVENNSFAVQGLFTHITNTMEIKVYLNGKRDDTYIFNGITKSFTHKLDLKEGVNTYLISLTNTCGTVQQEFTINYEAPQSCGVKIDLGSIDSDFCLFTSSGSFTRNDLMTNPDFVYKGEAKVVYFKASENGLATLNGVDYAIQKDNFYYFAGNLTVDIGRNKPGNIGQWVICVEGMRAPIFGKGSAKPASPCEATKDPTEPTPQTPRVPIIKETPDVQGTPTQREKPSRNNQNNPREEPSKPNEPVERGNVNTRNPRGGR